MKKVLIVEDEQETLTTLEELVKGEEREARVFLAGSEEQAYGYALKYTIDVFLVDLILEPGKKGGDLSGADFVQKVRKVEKYFFTPIIIITSLCDTKQYLYAETHCFQFVEKPFDLEFLKDSIRHALRYSTEKEEDLSYFYKKDGLVGAVRIGDIIYAKSSGQAVELVTVKERIRLPYKTIPGILDELDASEFQLCKRGTLVNKKYIQGIDEVNRYIYLHQCEDVLDIGPVLKARFLDWFYH